MKRKQKLAVIIATVAVIALSVGFYALKNAPTEEEALLFAERTDNYTFYKYNDGFLTYDGKLLSCYSARNEQKWAFAADDGAPILSVTGEWILLASGETDRIRLIRDGEEKISFTSDKNVRNAYVNSNGYSVILSSDSGYKGQCSVYNSKGERVARYSYGKKYILAAYLADDNKSLVMNIVDEEENMFKGKIVFTDIVSGKDKCEVELSGIAPLTVISDGLIVVSESNALNAYDKSGKLKWSYDYSGGTAQYIKTADGYITAVVKRDGSIGKTDIITFNKAGRIKGTYTSDVPVDAFDTSRGYSAAKTANEIKLLNKHGKITAFTECDANTYEVLLYKNENRALAISGTAEIKTFGR